MLKITNNHRNSHVVYNGSKTTDIVAIIDCNERGAWYARPAKAEIANGIRKITMTGEPIFMRRDEAMNETILAEKLGLA